MTQLDFSLIEVKGDRVKAIEGNDSESVREQFAREAETLQARAALIGGALGMSAVSSAAVASLGGSLAFRFASGSADDFDAKGIKIRDESFSVSSLLKSVR